MKLPNLKYVKQELISIPVFIVIIEMYRAIMFYYSPDTPMFDPWSELETFLVKSWQYVWLVLIAWLLIRMSFPSVHKYAVFMLNEGFEKIPVKQKRYITIIIYAIFLFGLIFLFNGNNAKAANVNECIYVEKYTEKELRHHLVVAMKKQLHVRELTGNNDGVDVEKFLAHVGHKKGASWCAAFCSWILSAFDIPNPLSAWSPDWAKVQDRVSSYLPGDCLTFYYPNLKRVGHVCFVTGESHGYYTTIEGNTGLTGSREGSGVHAYKRDKRKVYAITNYISRLYS